MQRIALKRERLKQPVADDIRKVVQLDRANARVRLDVAIPDSDRPASERIALLRQALEFDESIPVDELKRLSPEQVKAANDAIARLQK